MPRLFTGFEMPLDAARQLASFCGALPGARWTPPDDYHVTLSFIGDVDDHQRETIIEELASVRGDPLEIVLEGLSSFGGARPRALISTVRADSLLTNVHKQQERALKRAGIALERRRFIPHVTLARLRAGSPLDLAQYMSMYAPPVIRFRIDRFVLFSARPHVGGGPYLIEAAYPLGG